LARVEPKSRSNWRNASNPRRQDAMGRIDGWTDAKVDYCIALLVQAEQIVREVEPDLYEKIRRFLLEEA
jgi:hypothetical protein